MTGPVEDDLDDSEVLEDDARTFPVGDARQQRKARPRRTSLRTRSEAVIQSACQDVITERGGYVIKHHGSAHSRAGTPDLLGCLNGRMVVVEVKRPGERPTLVQLSELRRWQDARALAGWATCEQDVRDLLDRAGDVAWRNGFDRPGAPA